MIRRQPWTPSNGNACDVQCTVSSEKHLSFRSSSPVNYQQQSPQQRQQPKRKRVRQQQQQQDRRFGHVDALLRKIQYFYILKKCNRFGKIISILCGVCFIVVIPTRIFFHWIIGKTQSSRTYITPSRRILRRPSPPYKSHQPTSNFTIIFRNAPKLKRRFISPFGVLHGTFGPYFGNIDIRIIEEKQMRQQQRMIYHDYHADMGYLELQAESEDDDEEDVDSYYAFDDDTKRNPYTEYDDPNIQHQKHCRRTKWHREVPITCNNIHEFDFLNQIRIGHTRYLSHGAYRHVYMSSSTDSSTRGENEDTVMKIFQLDSSYSYEDYEFVRMDALVNEKVNDSPRIVQLYSYCGLSTISEAMVNGDMEHIAIPTGIGRVVTIADQSLTVRNTLSGTQKLEWSLDMAEAVLLLHSFPDGVIVHDDIQPSQFLVSSTGTLKLNDFNRAEIMLWNEKDSEYCKYRNHPGGGDWRAPEEYYDKPLDEKIDIWSLGNNMYALLTGLYPFYDSTVKEVQKKVMEGMIPFIDPRYKERSFAESKLTEIIPQCWIYDPSQRIDIFQLVSALRSAVRENRVHNSS